MFTKEEYLKKINQVLAEIKAEVELNNVDGFFDLNHSVEDFFCGLLNLIYGYELKNENHKKKNVKAIDLYDEKNKVAIQVTSENTHRKVQETIDKFIACERYENDCKLYVLLLKDKPDHNKAFETKGKFTFNKENNIWHMQTLAEKAGKLDTKKLEEIYTYLDYEWNGRENGEKRKSGKQYRKKRIAAPVLIAGALFLLVLVFGTLNWKKPVAKVEFSEVLPFEKTGYYETYENLPSIENTKIETERAFSILSFVRNSGKQKTVIEKIQWEISDLKTTEEPVILLDGCIMDDTLKLFAFNNGWGGSEALNMTSAVLCNPLDYSITEELEHIVQEVHFAENDGLESGEAAQLAEYVLDGEKFMELCKKYDPYNDNRNSLYLRIEVNGKDCADFLETYLVYENGKFDLSSEIGSVENEVPSVTAFAVLDVDRRPSSITINDSRTALYIENALRIETVLASTKSCVVECKNVFCINGEEKDTNIYTAKVEVPVFQDGAIGAAGDTGRLTRDLACLQTPDKQQIERLTEKYLYDPESLKETYIMED